MTFFRHKLKTKAIAFVESIAVLAESSTNPEEKRYLEYQVKEARHFIEYNEWYVGFEILTDNLYDIGYKMDASLIDSAKEIYLETDPSRSEETLWWLDELRKE